MPGFSSGLAFLSDIQVFLFLEAVQGDTRANVMQAQLTVFNGQTATLQVHGQPDVRDQRDGHERQRQVHLPAPAIRRSASLTLQPVISADRRFVRLIRSTRPAARKARLPTA